MLSVHYSAVPRSGKEVVALGAFVHRESWGLYYPYNAVAMLHTSDHVIAAYETGDHKPRLIGCCALTRHHGCPDDHNDKNTWLVCWAVADGFRGKTAGTGLYRRAFYEIKNSPGSLFASVDNDWAKKTLISRARIIGQGHGEWQFVRHGKNEDDSPMEVWRLDH